MIRQMRHSRQMLWLTIWVLAACNFGGGSDPAAQATIEALTAENARLATAVATMQSATSLADEGAVAGVSPLTAGDAISETEAPAAMPAAGLQSSSLPPDPAGAARDASGVLPAVVPLATGGQTLYDLQVDHAANRLYVTDTGGRLYVLDATTYMPLATLAAWGSLTLDETNQRLYVAPSDLASASEAAITVVDTQALTVVTTISNATHLSLDSTHNRLFVGNRLLLSNEENATGVRVLAADTLSVLAEGAQAGIPVYNSQRDALLIVAYTVYAADPATAQIREDLLPEISEQSLRWCNGCLMAVNAYVFPEANLALLDVLQNATGSGSGLAQPPVALDATTLASLGEPVTAPPLQPTCSGQPLLQPRVDGRLFRWLTFSRYVVYNNLLVYDEAGDLLTWRDGLPPLYVNGDSGQGYGGGWVFDLRTLNPVGRLAVSCVLGSEPNQGLVYAVQGGNLLVLAESTANTGAQAADAAASGSGPLPAEPVDQIVFSPNYGNDETFFVVSGGRALYRSTNSGQTWVALHDTQVGDLADLETAGPDAARTLAISPNYGNDRTVFMGGLVSDGQGEGVWRSTDGGASWQPVWTGLTHLRVRELAVSSHFAEDQTVLALSDYVRLDPWESGVSAHRSTDGGVSWSPTVTFTTETAPPDASRLLSGSADSTGAAFVPVRPADYGRAIEITGDGGETWQVAPLVQPLSGALILAIVPAPGESLDTETAATIYVLGDYGLWRVRIDGETESPGVVERWVDVRLEGRDYLRKLTALAVSPVLNNGSHRLALGTYAGELWLLDPAAMTWAPEGSLESAPVLDVATPTTATAPISATPTVTATAGAVTATVELSTPVPISPTSALTEAGALAGDPPDGLFRPEGMFAGMWAGDPALQSLLGWATTAEPVSTNAADQTFENGRMFWREDEQAIYVLYRDNTWEVFPDTFVEGQAESDPSLTAPANRLQPIRGFGKIWREQPEVRERLGWATAKEVGYAVAIHSFERGFLVRLGGLVYALGVDGVGRQVWRVV